MVKATSAAAAAGLRLCQPGKDLEGKEQEEDSDGGGGDDDDLSF